MRKLLTFVAALLITGSLLAGGLVTNTNQSAMFTRLQNRNASTGIDAVYFNPAGLTRLDDGFYLSVNNQTISQTQTITSDYDELSGTKPRTYIGEVSAPIYPGVYVAYKKGKLAFSGGFNVIGGGGGATYADGLPSIESRVAVLKPLLTSMGLTTTEYTADIFFEGSSRYFGYQANISYAINDIFSVAVGGRMVSAKNTYTGYIKNIMINPLYAGNNPPVLISAPAFFTSIGQPTYAAMTSDTEADAEMNGTGFTPILSLNIAPSEQINLSLRYEFKTKLDMTTTVHDNNGAGLFINDSVSIADMPAILSVGADWRPTDKLLFSGSFNYYFDDAVDWDGQDDVNQDWITKNFLEYGLGVEYSVSEKLRLSGGWVHTITGVNDYYQSDMSFSLNTNSFGGGFGYRISPMIDLNIGGQYTFYAEDKVDFPVNGPVSLTETYDKKTWLIAVGLDFSFGKGK